MATPKPPVSPARGILGNTGVKLDPEIVETLISTMCRLGVEGSPSRPGPASSKLNLRQAFRRIFEPSVELVRLPSPEYLFHFQSGFQTPKHSHKRKGRRQVRKKLPDKTELLPPVIKTEAISPAVEPIVSEVKMETVVAAHDYHAVPKKIRHAQKRHANDNPARIMSGRMRRKRREIVKKINDILSPKKKKPLRSFSSSADNSSAARPKSRLVPKLNIDISDTQVDNQQAKAAVGNKPQIIETEPQENSVQDAIAQCGDKTVRMKGAKKRRKSRWSQGLVKKKTVKPTRLPAAKVALALSDPVLSELETKNIRPIQPGIPTARVRPVLKVNPIQRSLPTVTNPQPSTINQINSAPIPSQGTNGTVTSSLVGRSVGSLPHVGGFQQNRSSPASISPAGHVVEASSAVIHGPSGALTGGVPVLTVNRECFQDILSRRSTTPTATSTIIIIKSQEEEQQPTELDSQQTTLPSFGPLTKSPSQAHSEVELSPPLEVAQTLAHPRPLMAMDPLRNRNAEDNETAQKYPTDETLVQDQYSAAKSPKSSSPAPPVGNCDPSNTCEHHTVPKDIHTEDFHPPNSEITTGHADGNDGKDHNSLTNYEPHVLKAAESASSDLVGKVISTNDSASPKKLKKGSSPRRPGPLCSQVDYEECPDIPTAMKNPLTWNTLESTRNEAPSPKPSLLECSTGQQKKSLTETTEAHMLDSEVQEHYVSPKIPDDIMDNLKTTWVYRHKTSGLFTYKRGRKRPPMVIVNNFFRKSYEPSVLLGKINPAHFKKGNQTTFPKIVEQELAELRARRERRRSVEVKVEVRSPRIFGSIAQLEDFTREPPATAKVLKQRHSKASVLSEGKSSSETTVVDDTKEADGPRRQLFEDSASTKRPDEITQATNAVLATPDMHIESTVTESAAVSALPEQTDDGRVDDIQPSNSEHQPKDKNKEAGDQEILQDIADEGVDDSYFELLSPEEGSLPGPSPPGPTSPDLNNDTEDQASTPIIQYEENIAQNSEETGLPTFSESTRANIFSALESRTYQSTSQGVRPTHRRDGNIFENMQMFLSENKLKTAGATSSDEGKASKLLTTEDNGAIHERSIVGNDSKRTPSSEALSNEEAVSPANSLTEIEREVYDTMDFVLDDISLDIPNSVKFGCTEDATCQPGNDQETTNGNMDDEGHISASLGDNTAQIDVLGEIDALQDNEHFDPEKEEGKPDLSKAVKESDDIHLVGQIINDMVKTVVDAAAMQDSLEDMNSSGNNPGESECDAGQVTISGIDVKFAEEPDIFGKMYSPVHAGMKSEVDEHMEASDENNEQILSSDCYPNLSDGIGEQTSKRDQESVTMYQSSELEADTKNAIEQLQNTSGHTDESRHAVDRVNSVLENEHVLSYPITTLVDKDITDIVQHTKPDIPEVQSEINQANERDSDDTSFAAVVCDQRSGHPDTVSNKNVTEKETLSVEVGTKVSALTDPIIKVCEPVDTSYDTVISQDRFSEKDMPKDVESHIENEISNDPLLSQTFPLLEKDDNYKALIDSDNFKLIKEHAFDNAECIANDGGVVWRDLLKEDSKEKINLEDRSSENPLRRVLYKDTDLRPEKMFSGYIESLPTDLHLDETKDVCKSICDELVDQVEAQNSSVDSQNHPPMVSMDKTALRYTQTDKIEQIVETDNIESGPNTFMNNAPKQLVMSSSVHQDIDYSETSGASVDVVFSVDCVHRKEKSQTFGKYTDQTMDNLVKENVSCLPFDVSQNSDSACSYSQIRLNDGKEVKTICAPANPDDQNDLVNEKVMSERPDIVSIGLLDSQDISDGKIKVETMCSSANSDVSDYIPDHSVGETIQNKDVENDICRNTDSDSSEVMDTQGISEEPRQNETISATANTDISGDFVNKTMDDEVEIKSAYFLSGNVPDGVSSGVIDSQDISDVRKLEEEICAPANRNIPGCITDQTEEDLLKTQVVHCLSDKDGSANPGSFPSEVMHSHVILDEPKPGQLVSVDLKTDISSDFETTRELNSHPDKRENIEITTSDTTPIVNINLHVDAIVSHEGQTAPLPDIPNAVQPEPCLVQDDVDKSPTNNDEQSIDGSVYNVVQDVIENIISQLEGTAKGLSVGTICQIDTSIGPRTYDEITYDSDALCSSTGIKSSHQGSSLESNSKEKETEATTVLGETNQAVSVMADCVSSSADVVDHLVATVALTVVHPLDNGEDETRPPVTTQLFEEPNSRGKSPSVDVGIKHQQIHSQMENEANMEYDSRSFKSKVDISTVANSEGSIYDIGKSEDSKYSSEQSGLAPQPEEVQEGIYAHEQSLIDNNSIIDSSENKEVEKGEHSVKRGVHDAAIEATDALEHGIDEMKTPNLETVTSSVCLSAGNQKDSLTTGDLGPLPPVIMNTNTNEKNLDTNTLENAISEESFSNEIIVNDSDKLTISTEMSKEGIDERLQQILAVSPAEDVDDLDKDDETENGIIPCVSRYGRKINKNKATSPEKTFSEDTVLKPLETDNSEDTELDEREENVGMIITDVRSLAGEEADLNYVSEGSGYTDGSGEGQNVFYSEKRKRTTSDVGNEEEELNTGASYQEKSGVKRRKRRRMRRPRWSFKRRRTSAPEAVRPRGKKAKTELEISTEEPLVKEPLLSDTFLEAESNTIEDPLSSDKVDEDAASQIQLEANKRPRRPTKRLIESDWNAQTDLLPNYLPLASTEVPFSVASQDATSGVDEVSPIGVESGDEKKRRDDPVGNKPVLQLGAICGKTNSTTQLGEIEKPGNLHVEENKPLSQSLSLTKDIACAAMSATVLLPPITPPPLDPSLKNAVEAKPVRSDPEQKIMTTPIVASAPSSVIAHTSPAISNASSVQLGVLTSPHAMPPGSIAPIVVSLPQCTTVVPTGTTFVSQEPVIQPQTAGVPGPPLQLVYLPGLQGNQAMIGQPAVFPNGQFVPLPGNFIPQIISPQGPSAQTRLPINSTLLASIPQPVQVIPQINQTQQRNILPINVPVSVEQSSGVQPIVQSKSQQMSIGPLTTQLSGVPTISDSQSQQTNVQPMNLHGSVVSLISNSQPQQRSLQPMTVQAAGVPLISQRQSQPLNPMSMTLPTISHASAAAPITQGPPQIRNLQPMPVTPSSHQTSGGAPISQSQTQTKNLLSMNLPLSSQPVSSASPMSYVNKHRNIAPKQSSVSPSSIASSSKKGRVPIVPIDDQEIQEQYEKHKKDLALLVQLAQNTESEKVLVNTQIKEAMAKMKRISYMMKQKYRELKAQEAKPLPQAQSQHLPSKATESCPVPSTSKLVDRPNDERLLSDSNISEISAPVQKSYGRITTGSPYIPRRPHRLLENRASRPGSAGRNDSAPPKAHSRGSTLKVIMDKPPPAHSKPVNYSMYSQLKCAIEDIPISSERNLSTTVENARQESPLSVSTRRVRNNVPVTEFNSSYSQSISQSSQTAPGPSQPQEAANQPHHTAQQPVKSPPTYSQHLQTQNRHVGVPHTTHPKIQVSSFQGVPRQAILPKQHAGISPPSARNPAVQRPVVKASYVRYPNPNEVKLHAAQGTPVSASDVGRTTGYSVPDPAQVAQLQKNIHMAYVNFQERKAKQKVTQETASQKGTSQPPSSHRQTARGESTSVVSSLAYYSQRAPVVAGREHCMEEDLATQLVSQITCEMCSKAAMFVCSACKAVAYCSQTCQTMAWESHSRVCR